jgi:NADPH-dependent ferric siderophore reductase
LPDAEADWHLFVGDETVLPAIAASLPHIPAGRPVVAVVLVDGPECELGLDCEADLTMMWLHRDRSGHDHDRQLRVLEDLSFPEGRVDGFVHGEASETRAVRRHLLADRNVAREHLSASPYWRCRFSDEDWRQVKKDWVAEMEAEV